MSDIVLGIDVGSTTVKLVVLDPSGEIRAHRYVRANGQPRETLLEASRLVDKEFPGARVLAAGLCFLNTRLPLVDRPGKGWRGSTDTLLR